MSLLAASDGSWGAYALAAMVLAPCLVAGAFRLGARLGVRRALRRG